MDTEPESRYRLLVNYLNSFDSELPDKGLLVRSAYFEAIFDVIDEVVRSSLALYKNAKTESLQKVVRPLARLNFSSATGRALPTKKAIVVAMQTALRQNVSLSEEML